MIQSDRTIGLYNAIFMMLLSSGLYNHVILTPILLKAGGRDAWIGILMASLVVPFLIFLISYISKKTNGMHMSLWVTQTFGKGIGYILTIPIAVCIFIMNCVTFKETIIWSIASYLPYTPPVALAIILAILCYCACMLGIRNIAYTAGILGPAVIILGLFIMTINMPKKHYTYIFPSFENGINPVLHSAFFTLGGIMELFLVLLFQQHLIKRTRVLYLVILSVFIIGITIGPLIGSVSVFGPEEALEQRYPAFELWRIATIGKYISHIDFFAIFQWLSGAFIRISLLCFLTIDLFRIQSPKMKGYVFAAIYIILIIFTLLPIDEEYFLSLIMKYYTVLILIVFGGATMLLTGFSIIKRKPEG